MNFRQSQSPSNGLDAAAQIIDPAQMRQWINTTAVFNCQHIDTIEKCYLLGFSWKIEIDNFNLKFSLAYDVKKSLTLIICIGAEEWVSEAL